MTVQQITKLFQQYMGYSPSSADISRFSMMPIAEVTDILKNTKSDVQSEATKKAQSAITSLTEGMPGGSTREYLESIGKGRMALEEMAGLPEAEKRMMEAEKFYGAIAQKGPMLETTMRGGLMEISPTFLGATRKDMEKYFSGIPNPFVRDRMVNSYLTAADRSMTATLNALNGLYQTSLLAAQTALEAERGQYSRISDKVKDLYSDLQWVNRNRFEEQQAIRMEEEMKRKGLGTYYKGPEAPTGEMKLYQELVDAGYTGSFEDFLRERGTLEAGAGISLPAKQQTDYGMIQSVTTSVQQLEGLLTEIGTIGFGPMARIKGLWQRGAAAIGLDPKVRAYQALRQSMIAPLARVISAEVGVLTDKDVKRAEGLLPKVGESTDEVNRKINNLKEAIVAKKISIFQAAGVPLTPDMFDF